MNRQEIILVGGGGHCRSVIDVIESNLKFKIIGIIDIESKVGQKIKGYEIIATDDYLEQLITRCNNFHIAIGHIKTTELRKKLFNKIKKMGGNFPVIISKNAYISSDANLGEGTIVMHHSIVNTNTLIGKNVIVNNKALLEHDCEVANHCHISTGAILNGGVTVGEGSFVGSGAVISQNLSIGSCSVIGSGSVVIKNVEANSSYVGNPARKI